MPRYIDADSFSERFDMMCDAGGVLAPVTKAVREMVKELIKAEPTTDVQEVKHGRWILDKEGTELVCSVCGGFAPLNYFKYHRVRSEYCPNCGARIDCKKEEINNESL